MLRLIIFFIYSIAIFFLPDQLPVLLIGFALNLIIALLCRLDILDILRSSLYFLPFILLVFIFNILLDSAETAVYVSLKLLLLCNSTMLFSKTMTTLTFASGVATLLSPLKIFGLQKTDVEILICVSLAMIPILKNDLRTLCLAARAKGMSLNIKNMKSLLIRLLWQMFERAAQLENALKAKGYQP